VSVSQIFLVIISGLGVAHGFFLAIFLWLYRKGNQPSNKILSMLLVILSFRVGKSVLLEFTQDLDIKLIFIGLGTLMIIGPLFYLYTLSYVDKAFQFRSKYLIHLIPAFTGICFGIVANDTLVKRLPILFFVMLFVVYYGQYLVYLLVSYSYFSKEKKSELNPNTYALLRLLFFALLTIWIVYVLNLFDDLVPYIVGPVLYTLVAYVISFLVIQKGYLKANDKDKYKTTLVSDEQIKDIFAKVCKLVIDEKQFKNEDVSLKTLSEQLNLSPQIISMVINKESKSNFNGFINRLRIQESISMFENEQYKSHTISSIALDVGFNSITSFNTAFKKEIGKTPLIFRKSLTK
jgi:AraC-like DNA-binding protein